MPDSLSSSMSKQRATLLDALNEALAVFCSHSEDTFDEVMESAFRKIANAVDCSHIFIDRKVEIDGETTHMRVYQWNITNGVTTVEAVKFFKEEAVVKNWVEALERGDCIYRHSSKSNNEEKAFMEKLCVKSILIVPIFTHGQFWGNVVFHNTEENRPLEEDSFDLIQSFALLCANAILRNDMVLEIIRQSELNERMAKDAAEAEAYTRIMLDAIPLCCQLWTNDFKMVDCNDTALKLFGLKSKKEFIERFVEFSPEFQPDGRLSREVGRSNLTTAFQKGRCSYDWMHILPDGTLLPAEITLARVSYKDDYVVAGFTNDMRKIKKMESSIQRLESESEKIYYDPLTDIYNRRFFDENLSRIVNTLSRSLGTLSLMMIDIDAFKKYNDMYGHSAGDECLRIIARTISMNATRVDDFVARYGGDELAVVLPNTKEDGACNLAEKIISSVRSCNIPHKGNGDAGIATVSVGVTTGKVRSIHRADDFILRADELLYRSKQNGRNRYTYGEL